MSMTNLARPGRRTLGASLLAGAALAAVLFSQGQSQPAQKLEIRTLSARPDLVSGGDVLVEVRLPAGITAATVKLTVNGQPSNVLHAEGATAQGLVTGLKDGANTLTVGGGKSSASLTVINHPITGPILSGPHLKPYECRTKESGLGEPTDANCSAPTKIEYFYKSTTPPAPPAAPPAGGRGAAPSSPFKPLANPTGPRPTDIASTRTIDGVTVPYIVRVESGVIDRSIYRIAVLDDPKAGAGGVWKPGPGWNHRLGVTFGGGAGTAYNQGTNQAVSTLSDLYLSRGFAYAQATELVNGLHANGVLQGEMLMMLKEHFIEEFGVPKWTVGTGGSGGAIQQLVITEMYPGLLDGLQPSLSFPDSTLHTADCGLTQHYFKTHPETASWTDSDHAAVEGLSKGTCASWESSFVPIQDATNVRGCQLAAKLVFDPVKNPKGVRCTISDMRVNVLGRDPKTGFARKPEDNVGLQYGLVALNSGTFSVDKFLDINEKIGGNDVNGAFVPNRSVGDPIALKATYASGLLNGMGGGLGNVPIIHSRVYSDNRSDIHSRERDLTIRARLQKANGRTDNQVIWVGGAPAAGQGTLASLSLDAMTKWLDAMAADPRPLSTDKVVRNKPAEAVDAYWNPAGQKVAEVANWDPNTGYNKAFPLHSEPRMAAGQSPAHDILKCQLKPIKWSDYKVAFTPQQQARMKQIFPKGVCDFSKPGVGQVKIAGAYQKY